jgi:predicted Zn-dependent protease
MRRARWLRVAIPGLAVVLAGCAGLQSTAAPDNRPAPAPAAGRSTPAPSSGRVDPQVATRVSRIMVPLLKAADREYRLDQVKLGIIDDPGLNAANAGSGQFYVTRGMLERANDEQLAAVLAHEVAHDDLGHVGKAQALGTGVGIGAAILDQIFPGVGQVGGAVAGTLITRAYSRQEELQADRHGVDLLRKAGWPKEAMERTLEWLKTQTGGGSGGGFFATHPGTDERIAALRKLH